MFSFAWSGYREVVTFSLAPSRVWLARFVLGFPLFSPGCLLFAVGLFVPGGRAPRASRRYRVVVAGAAGCWRCCFCRPNFSALSIWGQFRSKYTHAIQGWVTVTATLELKDSVLRSQSADVEVACGQLLGSKSFQFCLHLTGLEPLRSTKFIQQSQNIFMEGWL